MAYAGKAGFNNIIVNEWLPVYGFVLKLKLSFYYSITQQYILVTRVILLLL